MVEGFILAVDVGPDAPLAAVASVITDLNSVAAGASDLAVLEAEASALGYARRLLREGGPGALLREAQQRELPGAFGEGADRLHRLERIWREPEPLLLDELFFRARDIPPKQLRTFLAWSLYGAPPTSDPLLADLVQQLVADEARSALPDHPYRLRTLRYENPVTAEVIAAGAAAAAALAVLLGVVRDWGPRRRRENARADAEERIQAASARDAEDEAWMRAELRRLGLGAIRRGELHLSADQLSEVFTRNIAAAVDRLAERSLESQQVDLPDEPSQ